MGRSSIQKVEVRADGTGLSSRAGTALLPLAAERLGLTGTLGWALGETRERRSGHDPGRVFCDLAVMLADGGRCVSDLVALGSQPALFGDVASVSTVRRVLLSVGEAELDRLRAGDPRLRRDADHRAFGQGARGRPLQGRVRVSPAAGDVRAGSAVLSDVLCVVRVTDGPCEGPERTLDDRHDSGRRAVEGSVRAEARGPGPDHWPGRAGHAARGPRDRGRAGGRADRASGAPAGRHAAAGNVRDGSTPKMLGTDL